MAKSAIMETIGDMALVGVGAAVGDVAVGYAFPLNQWLRGAAALGGGLLLGAVAGRGALAKVAIGVGADGIVQLVQATVNKVQSMRGPQPSAGVYQQIGAPSSFGTVRGMPQAAYVR